MTKIVARLVGGLGNQLFIYAAARRLALVNNAELVLDDVSGFAYDRVYKRQYQLDKFLIPCRKATAIERLEPFSRIRRFLLRKLNNKRSFEKRRYIQQEIIGFDARLLDMRLQGTCHLEGLWQGEGYFKDIEKVIRADLTLVKPTDADNLMIADQMRNQMAVAVHVRCFDGVASANGFDISDDYYRQAIEVFENQLNKKAHYYVFSDRPERVSKKLSLPLGRVTYISHNTGDENAYADLWLMSKCKHFIIANSTFSWWGAWLAENEKSQCLTIAPRFYSVSGACGWGFEGLIPQRWMVI